MYKVIVAHPGQQHSYQTAIALKEKGMLYRYITTVYDSHNSLLMRVVKRFIRRDNLTRAQGRKTEQLDGCVTQFCELYGLMLLLILRLDKTKKRVLYNNFNQFLSRRFGRKVANYAIKHEVDAVICYDTSSTECFRILEKKAPKIIRILDNAAPNRYGLCKEYHRIDEESHIFEKQRDTFKEYLLDEKKAEPYRKEAELAHYHIVASSFSKRMLVNVGISADRIAVIPYGFETKHRKRDVNRNEMDKLRFLFVGEISPQKGIYDYIAVAQKFYGLAEFHAAGGGVERLPVADKNNLEHSIVYHGFLTKDQLFELYQQCDVLVFPSLGDGFGFVVLEALSFGLPVICSRNSVGADVIQDGYNGMLFDAGNVKQLECIISEMLEDRQTLRVMQDNVSKNINSFTWAAYGNALEKAVIHLKSRVTE